MFLSILIIKFIHAEKFQKGYLKGVSPSKGGAAGCLSKGAIKLLFHKTIYEIVIRLP